MGSDTRRGSRAYRSSRREAQARRTRRRVLDAATVVFLERGFAGATMRMIATRAGVSLSTVELLFGVVDEAPAGFFLNWPIQLLLEDAASVRTEEDLEEPLRSFEFG